MDSLITDCFDGEGLDMENCIDVSRDNGVDIVQDKDEAVDAELASNCGDSDPSNGLDSPLYQNASVTMHATLLLILAFSLSHKLTKEISF